MIIFFVFFLIFQQRYRFKSQGFLCQNIKHPYMMISIFVGCNGFLQFFRPLVPGVKCIILCFYKMFSVLLWHRACKTTHSIILFLILRKMPPPPLLQVGRQPHHSFPQHKFCFTISKRKLLFLRMTSLVYQLMHHCILQTKKTALTPIKVNKT